MKCLNIEQIYLFLEKELPPAENSRIHAHLTTCPKCTKALEERRLLLQAAEELPLWTPPPDFTQQIMARIFPARVSPWAWIGAVASGFATMVLTLFIFTLVTGQNLSDLLHSFYHTLLNSVKNFSPLFVKILKLVTVFLKILQQLGELLIKGLTLLSTIISPQVQIILISIAMIAIISSIYGLRKKLWIGEKA